MYTHVAAYNLNNAISHNIALYIWLLFMNIATAANFYADFYNKFQLSQFTHITHVSVSMGVCVYVHYVYLFDRSFVHSVDSFLFGCLPGAN